MSSVRKLVISSVGRVVDLFSASKYFQLIAFNAIRLNRPEARNLIFNENLRFLSYCLARRDQSRSQIMQDLWVRYELNDKPNGFFVEFGATNGFVNSNTWMLEKDLGWKGILAEPNPIWHQDLFKNRTAHIETKCVSSRSGDTVTFIATDDSDPELSGIANSASDDHFAGIRRSGRRIELETISLDDLLDQYDAPLAIDYLSIDTEGSEVDILSNYSFRHKFGVISIEHNPESKPKIDEIMRDQGYRKVFEHFSQWDSWYVSPEIHRRRNLTIVAPKA